MGDDFLAAWNGETTGELLAMADRYRIDSLVLAFEQAIQAKAPSDVSREESYVLAIEALEREVNNGGYSQFFLNSSGEFVPVIVAALRAIDCPKTAAITKNAIDALGLRGAPGAAALEQAASVENAARDAKLAACDDRYYANDEPIADRLFTWIGAHRDRIRIGKD